MRGPVSEDEGPPAVEVCLVVERVVVFGAGAVGTYLGARLAAVVPVTLVVRPAAARTIRRRGVTVSGRAELHLQPAAIAVASRLEALAPATLVIVAVKLTDLADAGGTLAGLARPDTTFLLIQNGLQGRELFLRGAGRPLRAARAIASTGVELLGPGRVVYAGGGVTLERSEDSAAIMDVLARAGIECTESRDFERALWKKLAVNCIANPLTALLGVRNRDIVTPQLEGVRQALCAEVAALAAAEGRPLPADLLSRIESSLGASENRTSMLQDLERGRPTEIEFLNGFVVRRSGELGLRAPVNETLAALVRAAVAVARPLSGGRRRGGRTGRK